MKGTFFIISILIVISISCSKKEKHANKSNISTISNNQDSTKNFVVIKPLNITYNCNMSFDAFFDLFSKDSNFQKSRIKYPLRDSYFYYDFDARKDTIKVNYITNEEFKYIDFTKDKNAMNQEFDKYTIDIERYKDSVTYHQNGYDNGIKVQFHFKKIDSCWFMTSIHDWSS